MNIPAKDYSYTNYHQEEVGLQLIAKITKDDLNIGDFILDIGCATGSLTAKLSKQYRGAKVIGIDIAKDMVEFATRNNSGDNNDIRYFEQDFSVEWFDLRPELKAAEGKVAIIYSNVALHWMYSKRENVAQNMHRLLAKNGKIYSHILIIPNHLTELEASFSSLLRHFHGIPTESVQQDAWTKTFKNSNLNVMQFATGKRCIYYSVNHFDLYIAPMVWKMCQPFYHYPLIMIVKMISNLLAIKPSNHLKQHTDNITGETMCNFVVHYFQFIISK